MPRSPRPGSIDGDDGPDPAWAELRQGLVLLATVGMMIILAIVGRLISM